MGIEDLSVVCHPTIDLCLNISYFSVDGGAQVESGVLH